jgi:hypothetical protein
MRPDYAGLPMAWAKEAVLVAGGGTDGRLVALTLSQHARVKRRVDKRFDTRNNQWRHAIEETKIARCDCFFRLDAH